MNINDFLASVLGENTSSPSDYQEIRRLDRMLTEAGIPHYFGPHDMDGYQLVYYGHKGPPTPEPGVRLGVGVGAVCSALECRGSYGHEHDRIEISGLLTDDEKRRLRDTVMGDLTAEEVFARIHAHWTHEKG